MTLVPLPIGFLSAWKLMPNDADRLMTLVEPCPADRLRTCRYLRQGAVVFAAMEYTRDVVGDAFGVAGGSGILTDGRFYWRGDAADYVEHYGIQPSAEFLEYGRSSGWKSSPVDDAVILEVDRHLYELRSVGRDPGRELIE